MNLVQRYLNYLTEDEYQTAHVLHQKVPHDVDKMGIVKKKEVYRAPDGSDTQPEKFRDFSRIESDEQTSSKKDIISSLMGAERAFNIDAKTIANKGRIIKPKEHPKSREEQDAENDDDSLYEVI